METSEALQAQQQVVRLQALLEASRQIHSTIDLDKVISIALQIVVRELEVTGAFFSTWPQAYGNIPLGLQEAIATENQDLADAFLSRNQSLRFPLRDKVGNVSTELVVLFEPDRILSLDEIDFLESLSVQLAVAIENAKFHQRALQWQRVESDLAAARQVQQSLVPQQMPAIPGYDLAARSVTCYEVGGDYLDVVSMASGELTIIVADVAGKGLASALVGTSFRSAFRAMVNAGLTLQEIATRMNQLHYDEGEEARRRYVTVLLLRLNPLNHTLEAVNAGHNPALLVEANGTTQQIAASGTPIGMLPFSTHHPETFTFSSGARLLVYTDGMTEVFCGSEEFGETGLFEAFIGCSETTAEGTIKSLWKTLEGFSDGREQSDDMTALVLFRV